jgi:protein-S-isoprenylcysteine O-methyltransferase Ste14
MSRRTGRQLPLARLGDIGLATWWTLLSVNSVSKTIDEIDEVKWLTTAHHSISSLILCVTVFLFIFRHPAKTRSSSWRARVVAITGTWAAPVLIMLPLTWTPDWLLSISTAALVLLHLFMLWALLTLRRSLSIFAEARNLVRTGPYALVRHPLYATYFAMYPFFLLPRLSLLAVVVSVVGFTCEAWRAFDEEKLLRASLPGYEEYAVSTPRFVPRLFGR